MNTEMDEQVEKYEEKFIRKLGEVAILLHLAKTPEGSHAYEMRQKASEIFFKRRNMDALMIQAHLNLLKKLKALFLQLEVNPDDFDDAWKNLKIELDDFMFFKFNIRFQNLFSEGYIYKSEDLEYVENLIADIENITKSILDTSVIWTNISGIYPAIDSLEKGGLIEMIGEDLEGGRLKKIYSITDVGKKSLSKVMSSLMDISAFIFETQAMNIIQKDDGILSSKMIPLRRIIAKLADDISPEFKKKLLSFKNEPQDLPHLVKLMQDGLNSPRLNILVNNPDLLEEQLEGVESEEDRNFWKRFIRNRLLERRKLIDNLLKKL